MCIRDRSYSVIAPSTSMTLPAYFASAAAGPACHSKAKSIALIRMSGSTLTKDRAGAAGWVGNGLVAEDAGTAFVAAGVVAAAGAGAGCAGAVATGIGLRGEKANNATTAITPIATMAPTPIPAITNTLEASIEE